MGHVKYRTRRNHKHPSRSKTNLLLLCPGSSFQTMGRYCYLLYVSDSFKQLQSISKQSGKHAPCYFDAKLSSIWASLQLVPKGADVGLQRRRLSANIPFSTNIPRAAGTSSRAVGVSVMLSVIGEQQLSVPALKCLLLACWRHTRAVD